MKVKIKRALQNSKQQDSSQGETIVRKPPKKLKLIVIDAVRKNFTTILEFAYDKKQALVDSLAGINDRDEQQEAQYESLTEQQAAILQSIEGKTINISQISDTDTLLRLRKSLIQSDLLPVELIDPLLSTPKRYRIVDRIARLCLLGPTPLPTFSELDTYRSSQDVQSFSAQSQQSYALEDIDAQIKDSNNIHVMTHAATVRALNQGSNVRLIPAVINVLNRVYDETINLEDDASIADRLDYYRVCLCNVIDQHHEQNLILDLFKEFVYQASNLIVSQRLREHDAETLDIIQSQVTYALSKFQQQVFEKLYSRHVDVDDEEYIAQFARAQEKSMLKAIEEQAREANRSDLLTALRRPPASPITTPGTSQTARAYEALLNHGMNKRRRLASQPETQSLDTMPSLTEGDQAEAEQPEAESANDADESASSSFPSTAPVGSSLSQ